MDKITVPIFKIIGENIIATKNTGIRRLRNTNKNFSFGKLFYKVIKHIT